MKTITKNKNAVVLFITILLLLFANFKILAQCPTAPGNPSVYGSGSWIGYVYADGTASAPSPITNTFSTPYRGFLTQSENFYQDLGTGAISGANICGSYSNRFSIRFRMQRTFVAGTYNINVGGDDGYRLSLDGGTTWAINNWGIFPYQSTTITVSLSGTRDLVLEYFENDGASVVSFAICQGNSTAPTSISGTNIICSGSSTTLTANGGIEGVGSFYQWGTGTTVGSNIISGQNDETLTISPTTSTTYWVRRRESAPCNITTSGITYTVTVNSNSTAPTTISGATTICVGQNATLTATGGTTGSGASFQWGTGTVGSNIIAGQTTSSITVSPTSTTTYWVRRTNASPCSTTTSAVSATVNVTSVGGDEVSYGNNEWIGYVYSSVNTTNPPSNVFDVDYKGFFTQPEQFDLNLSTNVPLQGPNICGSYLDRFSVRYKMNKTFVPGFYTITLGGDDGVRLSLDGGATFVLGNFRDQSYTLFTQSFYLSGSMNLVIEYYEQGGFSRASFNYDLCTNVNTAPTAIAGTTDLCVGTGGTTLTAVGGFASPGSTYQWGTGTLVGSNIIGGQTNISMYINPSVNTTYWVRRIGGNCNVVTDGVTLAVNVAVRSTNPTNITGTTSICQGNSVTLTATGGTTAAGGSFQWGTGFNAGSNILAGETNASITVTPSATTTYWVRRVDPAPCNTETTARTITISVTTPSVAPTAISGVTVVCSNATSTSLTAVGGFRGSNGNYQWGTGSVIGSNIIGGQTNATIFINPSSTTTYWVRLVDGSPCSNNTAGITQVVTVSAAAVNPTSISGITTICNGNSTTLTAIGGSVGSNSEFQWGIGTTIGSNIISGETNASITVSPTTNTTYWVRRVDASPCATLTWGRTTTVTVRNSSSAPTGITGIFDLCVGAGGTTLTATGGTLGSNATYQWGTGTTIGSNVISGQTNVSMYINPSITTTYWVRIVDGSPCSQNTNGVSQLVNVSIRSSAPTGISGIVTICEGTSLTLTATGGTEGTNSEYEWGTGSTVGLNVIIGETANTITVTPSTTTNYWVRRLDSAPCAGVTGGIVRTVTVRAASTAPTAITGAGSVSCSGTNRTLTATGGTAASGSTFEWGTGTIAGSNIISGQTGASITVNPSTTTTYWVRRRDTTPCSTITDAAFTTVGITAIPGDPNDFGNNVWNLYGYNGSDLNLTSAFYQGFYTVSGLNFNTQSGTNSWSNNASPSASAGWNGCPVNNNNFTFTVKRIGFPCGNYTLRLNNWDDQTRVYVNGVIVWTCNTWSGSGAACNGLIGTYNLDATSTIEIRVRENSGLSNVNLAFTKNDISPTNPTSISGVTILCSGGATTLVATGGTMGTNGAFQWGIGSTVGSNIISGQTTASMTVTPTTTTTYWTRRIDTLCNTATAGMLFTVTVTQPTVSGSLSTPIPLTCSNRTPEAISLTGNVGNVLMWQYASNAAFTTGITNITSTSTTLTSAQIGTLSATRYFRAMVQNGNCAFAYTTPVAVIVPETVVYNGTWSGTPTSETPAIISANLTLTGTLHVCSCEVNNNAVITVPSNMTLLVEKDVNVAVNSNIIIENNGSLVQRDNAAVNIGSITMKRNTTPMKQFDYTYWSSPVENFTLNTLSPATRFDKFFHYNPMISNWVVILNGLQVMLPGKGYIVRAPDGWSNTNASGGIYSATFTGKPNSGIINVPVQKGPSVLNLIGNPYPSAVDIDEFIMNPANAALFNGTIYLWTHNTAISSAIPGGWAYNYTNDDYAKYNLTGGVKTASFAITGTVAPTGKVAAGQGFFIEMQSGLANGNYNGVFNNEMRVVNQNSQFFRPTMNQVSSSTLEKNRLWLNISNVNGAYDETLIGYITGATNGMDYGYDGKVLPGNNVVGLYTMIGTNNLSIQGRALPFNNQDVIPLGYKSTIVGNLTIAIENLDGFFTNQNVFLRDNLLNIDHPLNQGGYTFTTTAGTFNSRFEIRFASNDRFVLDTVKTDEVENNVSIFKAKESIAITSELVTINSVSIFDISGKLLYQMKDINENEFKTRDLNMASQVLIVKVTLENDEVITKKVIF